MNNRPLVVLGSLGFLVTGIAVAGLFATNVPFAPPGVKEYDREKYENIVSEMKRVSKLRMEADELKLPVAFTTKTQHDFGRLDPHTTQTQAFEIENRGFDSLLLEVGETSCKCTLGSLGSRLVPPGGKTAVTLTWNTGYQADTYEQIAIIETNDPARQEIEFTVKGEIRAELMAPEKTELAKADPGERCSGSVGIFSQLFQDFTVVDVQSDLPLFNWDAKPMELSRPELADTEATSAMQIDFNFDPPVNRGDYSGEMTIECLSPIDGGTLTRTVNVSGSVRAPINFYGNEIDMVAGFDMGTLTNNKEHTFHFTVRARSEDPRELVVSKVVPEMLKTKLTKTNQVNEYRLTLQIPANAPMTMFNRNDQRGYIEVADANDVSFSNWLPLIGAVVKLDQ